MDKIKLVVFDLYGTLIYLPDKFKSYAKLTRALATTDKRLPAEKFSVLMTTDFRNLDKMKELVFPGADIDLDQWKNEIEKEVESAKIFPETLEVMEKLKKSGCKIGVISNLATPYKRPFYTLGIDKYCDCRIFSCEAGCKKPEAEIYRLMENKFSLRGGKIIMIGDNYVSDYATPIFLGWKAVFLSRSGKSEIVPSVKDLNGIFAFMTEN